MSLPHVASASQTGPSSTPSRRERDRLLAFALTNADILLELDRQMAAVYCAGAVGALLGRTPDALIGRPLTDLVTAGDRVAVTRRLAEVAPNRRLSPLQVRFLLPTGRTTTAVLSGYRLDASDGGFFLTLSARWPTVETLTTVSERDGVSGLLDREGFRRRLSARLRRRERKLGQSRSGPDGTEQLSLLHLGNLDKLEAELGGEGVARVLEEVGAALRAHAVDGDCAGRLAADRFGILHAGNISFETIDQAARAAAEAASDNREHLSLNGTSLPLDQADMDDDTLLRVLSYAINRFAEQPPEAFGLSDLAEGVRAMMAETVSRVVALKDTLSSRGFSVRLQPIMRLDDRSLHHFEMLSRFPDTFSPAETVAFAEDTGLVLDLDLLICEHAIGLLKQAKAQGADLSVAVNLSGRSMDSPLFLDGLEKMLRQPNLDRAGLMFEITETALIKDLSQADRMVQSLRGRGHRVCLDDFGAGAASFTYIRALPVDFVKIDGMYIRSLLRNPRDQAIVNAMVTLCRDLDCGTIAEFVETDAQSRALASLGVTLGQGFLFGRPTFDDKGAIEMALTNARCPAPARGTGGVFAGVRRSGARESWE